uniref:Uncharacterized protein n=1 Tax=viral metagenome TaxID=1070528 RepID=A0A6C0HT88_9ZZZZ
MSKENFSRKAKSNYVDLLEEDKPISGQKFVCMSFISPEKILKQKDAFFFQEFLKRWDFNKSMEKFVQFLNFISYKYNLTFEDVTKDFNEFITDEKENLIKDSNFENDYKTFVDKCEEELEASFNKMHNFQTSTRGVKIRGSYSTQEEAELRCKLLREVDPNHDILVGPIGVWMPWDPEAYKTGKVEYLEEELNQLMNEKNKNESFAKSSFEQRIKETKQKAMDENKKKAELTGNKLTQTLDENGNLVGIKNMNTQEKDLGENVTIEDIHATLFEGENIVTDKNTDHGAKALVGDPFKLNE